MGIVGGRPFLNMVRGVGISRGQLPRLASSLATKHLRRRQFAAPQVWVSPMWLNHRKRELCPRVSRLKIDTLVSGGNSQLSLERSKEGLNLAPQLDGGRNGTDSKTLCASKCSSDIFMTLFFAPC